MRCSSSAWAYQELERNVKRHPVFKKHYGANTDPPKALKTALDSLGVKTYHTAEALANHHLPYWNEAIAAKYGGEGEPYDVNDFEKLLKNYQVIPLGRWHSPLRCISEAELSVR